MQAVSRESGDHVGQVLDGRYQLTAVLSVNPLGTLYRGRQRRLRRDVAVKVLSPTVEPASAARFLAIAEALAALDHPNCISVTDLGTEGEAMHYAVMPLIEGETLRERIATGPLDPESAARIAAAVLRGLGHAHRHHLVHRDINPSCIVIPADGADLARVTGFWSASVRVAGEEQVGVTVADLVTGGAEYNSPEQALGLETDERTDLYSLGIVLYEMLTGKPPFTGPDAVAVLQMHMTSPLPDLPESVPEHLRTVVARLTQKGRADRYGSASDATIDLEHFVTGEVPAPAPAAGTSPMTPPAAHTSGAFAGTSTQGGTAPAISGTLNTDSYPMPSQSIDVPPRRPGVLVAIAIVVAGLGFSGAYWYLNYGPGATGSADASEDSTAAVAQKSTPPESEGISPTLSKTLRTLALVNETDPAKAAPFSERTAKVAELEAGGHGSKIDRRLQVAMNLLQAPDSPTPCKTFSEALTAIAEAEDAYYKPSLRDASPPTSAPGAGQPPDDSCDGLQTALDGLRGTPPTAEAPPATQPAPTTAPAPQVAARRPAPRKRPADRRSKRRPSSKPAPDPIKPPPKAPPAEKKKKKKLEIKKLDEGIKRL